MSKARILKGSFKVQMESLLEFYALPGEQNGGEAALEQIGLGL